MVLTGVTTEDKVEQTAAAVRRGSSSPAVESAETEPAELFLDI